MPSSNISILELSKKQEIDTTKTFYVPIAYDGKDLTSTMGIIGTTTEKVSQDSGSRASNILYNALTKKKIKAVLGVTAENEKEALENATQKQLDYVIYIKLYNWVDASIFTCNSAGMKDHATADLSVYDVATKKIINLQKLESVGCPFIFKLNNIPIFSIGDSTPEDRFVELVKQWIAKVIEQEKLKLD